MLRSPPGKALSIPTRRRNVCESRSYQQLLSCRVRPVDVSLRDGGHLDQKDNGLSAEGRDEGQG